MNLVKISVDSYAIFTKLAYPPMPIFNLFTPR